MLRIISKNIPKIYSKMTITYDKKDWYWIDLSYDEITLYTKEINMDADKKCLYVVFALTKAGEKIALAEYTKLEFVEVEMNRLINLYVDANKDIISPGPFYFNFRLEQEIIKEARG